VVLKVGSHAIRLCESGQMRKQAAISICTYVPWGCLAGANCVEGSMERGSKKSARPKFKLKKYVLYSFIKKV
jgi:hypothetical protein